jgi:general secretion pathway protein F
VPVFEYVSLDPQGGRGRGRVDAESADEARRRLRAAGVHLVELRVQAAGGSQAEAAGRAITLRRVKARDVASATTQFATLLRAGLPVVPALSALVEQLAGHPLAGVLADARDRVNAGSTLAAALERHPVVFSEVYVNMVRAGESAGALPSILMRLAEMTERRAQLTARVKAALAYPLFMALVGAGVILFLLAAVIPSIAKLFVEMGRQLPWPTEALIRASRHVQDYGWIALLGAAAAAALVRLWIRRPAGRLVWDRLMLRIPLFGGLLLKMAVSRFARTLAVLLGSGVSILDALDIVKRLGRNAVLARAVDMVQERVRRGEGLSTPLRATGVFPPIVFHMVATSESSGNVEEGLNNVADAYDRDIESGVAALTSLLEPVLILVMGVLVGFIVLAILLPIFDINQAIR